MYIILGNTLKIFIFFIKFLPYLLSKCKTSGKSGNLLEKEWRELNAGQSVLEWKISTLKWVWKLNFHSQKSGTLSSKIPFTPFRVFFHSKTYCPAFNSYKEWKSTLLHLESSVTDNVCMWWLILRVLFCFLFNESRNLFWKSFCDNMKIKKYWIKRNPICFVFLLYTYIHLVPALLKLRYLQYMLYNLAFICRVYSYRRVY